MRILVDTVALLWAWAGDPRVKARAAARLDDPANEIFVSVVSPWEIAVKKAIGKLDVDLDAVREELSADRYNLLGISVDHALAVADLPLHHRDPFDRLLVAQARAEGLAIISHDRVFRRYGVRVLSA